MKARATANLFNQLDLVSYRSTIETSKHRQRQFQRKREICKCTRAIAAHSICILYQSKGRRTCFFTCKLYHFPLFQCFTLGSLLVFDPLSLSHYPFDCLFILIPFHTHLLCFILHFIDFAISFRHTIETICFHLPN